MAHHPEHVWRAEALAFLLAEAFWAFEERIGLSEDTQFMFARPFHLRYVAEMLSEQLTHASDGMGELEPEPKVEE